MSDEVSEKIRTFLIDTLHWSGDRGELAEEFPLITSRTLDSLGLMQLVTFIEDEFDVVVEDEELLPDRFGTIRSISTLVHEKLAK